MSLVADGFKLNVARANLNSIQSSVARAKNLVSKKAGPITPTMRDTPPVAASYKTRMNQFVAPGIGLGLDGQTMAYFQPTKKQGKKIFAGKYVPMTDGTDLLTDAAKKTMSQRGYGNVPESNVSKVKRVCRIGFNNTLVDTSGGSITKSMAKPLDFKGIIMHPNNPVKSDFPRGPGVGGSAPLWEDGTYDMIHAQIQKVQDAMAPIQWKAPPDPRREVFDEQALVGGELYGNELLKQTIADSFANEQAEELERLVREVAPDIAEDTEYGIANQIRQERRAEQIAQRLKLGTASPIVQQIAAAQLEAEAQNAHAKQEIQERQAAMAEARRRENEESRKTSIRTRIGRGLGRVGYPGLVSLIGEGSKDLNASLAQVYGGAGLERAEGPSVKDYLKGMFDEESFLERAYPTGGAAGGRSAADVGREFLRSGGNSSASFSSSSSYPSSAERGGGGRGRSFLAELVGRGSE